MLKQPTKTPAELPAVLLGQRARLGSGPQHQALAGECPDFSFLWREEFLLVFLPVLVYFVRIPGAADPRIFAPREIPTL
jgi:hypothetical protein